MAKRTRKLELPYGSGPFYAALVAAGAEFCSDCRSYVMPGHETCDPDALMGNWANAQGPNLQGGAVNLDGGLEGEEIAAEAANAEAA